MPVAVTWKGCKVWCGVAAARKLEGLGGREASQAASEARLAERAARLDRDQSRLEAEQAALRQEQERLQTATKVAGSSALAFPHNFLFPGTARIRLAVNNHPQQGWHGACMHAYNRTRAPIC